MLHYSAIYPIVERKNQNGDPVEFSIRFVKISTGAIVQASHCICTSSHYRPRTINVKFTDSQEFRKIRTCSIVELNGIEVYV